MNFANSKSGINSLYKLSEFSKLRFKIRYNYILKLIRCLHIKTILDVGCGNGVYTHKLRRMGYKVIGLDVVKKFPGVIECNVLNMKLKDNSFDLVLCVGVLPYIQRNKLSKVIKELARVGKFYVIIDFENKELYKKDIDIYTKCLRCISIEYFAINKFLNRVCKRFNSLAEFSVSLYGKRT